MSKRNGTGLCPWCKREVNGYLWSAPTSWRLLVRLDEHPKEEGKKRKCKGSSMDAYARMIMEYKSHG